MIKKSVELLDQESADSWTHTNCLATDWNSECGWELVHGGAGRFGKGCKMSKTYSFDIPHYKAGVRFDTYIIDAWDDKESISLKIDSVVVSFVSVPFLTRSNNFGNFGGMAYNDHFQVSYNIFNHELNTLNVEIYDDLNEETCNESWGISNFQLFFYICHSSCLTCSGPLSTNCQTCYSYAKINANYECKCELNNYMLINSTECDNFPCSNCVRSCPDGLYGSNYTKFCSPCDQSCWTCNGELSNQCTKCRSGFFLLTTGTVNNY